MPRVRSAIATVARQFSDCPGCGRDLDSVYGGASFCPGCGKQLKYRRTVLQRAMAGSSWHFLLGCFARPGLGHPSASDPNQRTPILIGYGNALFRLGWRYERAGAADRNLAEAIRCYRKSARLGNLDAMVRLALDDGTVQPEQVITLTETCCATK